MMVTQNGATWRHFLDRTHFQQRRGIYFLRKRIPNDLVVALRATHYIESLRTRDLREANRLKHERIAQLNREWDALRRVLTAPQGTIEWAVAELDAYREAHRQEPMTEAAVSVVEDTILESLRKTYGTDDRGYPLIPPAAETSLQAAFARFRDTEIVTLQELEEAYFAAKQSAGWEPQTTNAKKRRIEAFARWFGPDRPATEVTRRAASRYVRESLLPLGRRPKTDRDEVGDLSAFFNWAQLADLVPANPFAGLTSLAREPVRGRERPRRAWKEDELRTLFEGLEPGDRRWQAAALATFSGMRISEIAELRLADIGEGMLHIREGKTASAVRTVPIHPVIQPLVVILRASTDDEYLLAGLRRGGENQRRSHYLSKRFGSAKTRLGLKSRQINFHTLRNTFIEALERSGVEEATAKQIVGHERTSLTYGTYSGGIPIQQLLSAVQRVSHGAIDGVVAKGIEALSRSASEL